MTDKELTVIPEYLTPTAPGQKIEGLDLDDGRVLPNFLKVVQPSSRDPYKPPHKEGDLIITPQNQKIVSLEESFHFVPIFFWYEYTIQNPIQVKGLDFIREKTLDPNSAIAMKAKNQNPKARAFPCPENGDYNCSYVEHMNFLWVLLDHNETIGISPVVMSFFNTGWKNGMTLKELIKARSSQCQYMYGCQFRGFTARKSNDQGSWYLVNVMNPAEVSPFVQEKQRFEVYRELYQGFKKSHEQMELDVDYAGKVKEEEF